MSKIGYAILVLWGIVSLVFFLFNVLPDDPAKLILGQRTDKASIENIRKQLHLDESLGKRYVLYLNDLSPISIYPTHDIPKDINFSTVYQSDHNSMIIKNPYLGRSYHSKKLVWDLMIEAIPGTLILAFSALLLGTLLGIILGVISALRKDSIWDTSAILGSVVGISTPSFFAGLLIAYIFGFVLREYTGLSMVGNLMEYDIHGNRYLQIQNLILPAITLGIRPMAIIAQLTRSSMLDVLSLDFVRTARAKGLSEFRVIFRHALPNALNPVVTAISGWLAELLSGSFFVEFIFSWKGLGKMTVESLEKFDFPVVMGALLFSATIFIVINMLTDLVYKWLDPRIY